MSFFRLVDAGPLVGYLSRTDRFHPWCVEQFRLLQAPLLTCEPVLTEAAHLLRRTPGGPAALMGLLRCGAIQLAFELRAEAEPVSALMSRYADVPMSLADACLVRMTELFPSCRLVTLDQDFLVYRRDGRKLIPVLSPER